MIKSFPTTDVLSLATGKMLSTFGGMWEVADYTAGRPLMTHNFASQDLHNQLRQRLLDQHPWLAGAIENVPDFEALPDDQIEAACRAWVADIAAHYGDTVPLTEPVEPVQMTLADGLEHLGGAR